MADARAQIEREEANRRSSAHPKFQHLRTQQQHELHRFLDFSTKARITMDKRHAEQKTAMIEHHQDVSSKMQARHARTAGQLEDRQVAAEMELRTTLEQSERSIRVRLKHMEAYCDGLGRPVDSRLPRRVVTERDLRELGQQYNIRDNIDRLNQSKINVMRVRQTKQMEELLNRQDIELSKMAVKTQNELEDLATRFAQEEYAVIEIFKARQNRLQRRWKLSIEILAKEIEVDEKMTYGLIDPPSWPTSTGQHEGGAVDPKEKGVDELLLLPLHAILPSLSTVIECSTAR